MLLLGLLDLPLVCLLWPLFANEIWDLLVEETNRYAAQIRASLTSPHARPWHNVDRDEMKAFVGMLMAMGL